MKDSQENSNLETNNSDTLEVSNGISGNIDYWKEATDFSKQLVVSDIEEKFIKFIEERKFNHNEVSFFRLILQDAIGLNFVIGQLKASIPDELIKK